MRIQSLAAIGILSTLLLTGCGGSDEAPPVPKATPPSFTDNSAPDADVAARQALSNWLSNLSAGDGPGTCIAQTPEFTKTLLSAKPGKPCEKAVVALAKDYVARDIKPWSAAVKTGPQTKDTGQFEVTLAPDEVVTYTLTRDGQKWLMSDVSGQK